MGGHDDKFLLMYNIPQVSAIFHVCRFKTFFLWIPFRHGSKTRFSSFLREVKVWKNNVKSTRQETQGQSTFPYQRISILHIFGIQPDT